MTMGVILGLVSVVQKYLKNSYECEFKKEDLHRYMTGYCLFYKYDGKTWVIDAMEDSSHLGHLMNNEPDTTANAKPYGFRLEGKLYMFIYAKRDIAIGEQIVWDYGEKNLPWRNVSS